MEKRFSTNRCAKPCEEKSPTAYVQILKLQLNLEREAVRVVCACGEGPYAHVLNVLDCSQSGVELSDGNLHGRLQSHSHVVILHLM